MYYVRIHFLLDSLCPEKVRGIVALSIRRWKLHRPGIGHLFPCDADEGKVFVIALYLPIAIVIALEVAGVF